MMLALAVLGLLHSPVVIFRHWMPPDEVAAICEVLTGVEAVACAIRDLDGTLCSIYLPDNSGIRDRLDRSGTAYCRRETQ